MSDRRPAGLRGLRPTETLAARWTKLEPHLEFARPAGEGPWPAVIIFHGCGGRRPYLADYMRAIAEAGILAISADSFTPRGIGRQRALAAVCTGLELPGWTRAGDVLACLWGVRGIDGVDPARIALAGWSHGGWSIMDLMTMALTKPGEAGISDPDPALIGAVKALVLAYPYCGPGALTQLRAWRRGADVFAFVGEGDRVAHPDLCRRAFRAVERAGGRLTTWYPPAATHAFDEEASGFSFFRYDEALKAEAVRRVAAFLAQAFDGAA